MPRSCTICSHPERVAIDKALVAGESLRTIADRWSVSKTALIRHKEAHLPASLVQAGAAREIARADGLLAEVQELQAKTLTVLRQAEANGEPKMVLLAVKEARANLEFLAKLLGELKEGQTVNILVLPEWQQIKAVIANALAPFPEARGAVAAALRKLGDAGP